MQYINKPVIKNFLLILIIGIFLISLVNAGTSWGTYKQNDCVYLTIVSDGDNCVMSSLKYPNSTTIQNNITLTKIGNEFNFTNCNTISLGIYEAKGMCDYTPWTNNFEVTPSGLSQSTAQGISSAIFLTLMIFLTFLFGYIGFRLSKGNLWILGLFFLFLSVLMIIYDVWLGYEYHRLLTGFTDSSMPEIIFYILMFILVSGLLISMALLFLKWKKVFKYIKREIKKKDDDSKDVEDWDLDKWGGSDFGK